MDDLDHKIIQLLVENARMPVKDIAQQVNLTSPAVSSRIHRLEQEGIIGGYTVVLRHPDAPARVEALISVLVAALVFGAVVHSQLAYYYATPYYR